MPTTRHEDAGAEASLRRYRAWLERVHPCADARLRLLVAEANASAALPVPGDEGTPAARPRRPRAAERAARRRMLRAALRDRSIDDDQRLALVALLEDAP